MLPGRDATKELFQNTRPRHHETRKHAIPLELQDARLSELQEFRGGETAGCHVFGQIAQLGEARRRNELSYDACPLQRVLLVNCTSVQTFHNDLADTCHTLVI